jgi:translocation and assembly module TamA
MLNFLRQYSIQWLVLIVILGFANSARAAWWWPFGDKGIDYGIVIEGVAPETMRWFKKLGLNQKTKQHPPENLAELAQSGMDLQKRLNEALQAKGYYNAQIEQKLETKPVTLHYFIKPGTRAIVNDINIKWQQPPLTTPALDKLEQKAGEAVDAEKINNDAVKLQKEIGDNACLLSLSVTPTLVMNPATYKASLNYNISYGPPANFGPVIITGNETTKDTAIKRLLTWKQGECFSEDKIAKSQSALFGSQLFSAVKITHGTVLDDKGQVPITIELKERSPRTVSAGMNYATDQGFGLKFGWEHRNFSGSAEKVNVNAVIAQQEQSLSLTERIPGFLRDDQSLALAFGIKREDTDAYTSLALNSGANVERKIMPSLTGSLGIAYDLKQTEDILSGSEVYSLISLPANLEYDTRDNAQDAKKGLFARVSVTPYQDMLSANLHFFKTTLTGQAYFSADMDYQPTLALRASLGSIAGSPYRLLPSDLRYYAGGGGSVRGYSYQSLSPRVSGEPIGGGSLVELSSEARLRFSETIGGVAFIDAGNAYAGNKPDFSEKLYFGAGVGVRYYSGIGPIRLDVAMPLNGKDIGQDSYAIYVSLGQAF